MVNHLMMVLQAIELLLIIIILLKIMHWFRKNVFLNFFFLFIFVFNLFIFMSIVSINVNVEVVLLIDFLKSIKLIDFFLISLIFKSILVIDFNFKYKF